MEKVLQERVDEYYCDDCKGIIIKPNDQGQVWYSSYIIINLIDNTLMPTGQSHFNQQRSFCRDCTIKLVNKYCKDNF